MPGPPSPRSCAGGPISAPLSAGAPGAATAMSTGSWNRPATVRPRRTVGALEPSGNRPATVRQPSGNDALTRDDALRNREQGTGEQKNPLPPAPSPSPRCCQPWRPRAPSAPRRLASLSSGRATRARSPAAAPRQLSAQAVERDGPDVIITGLRTWTTHWRDAGTEEQVLFRTRPLGSAGRGTWDGLRHQRTRGPSTRPSTTAT